MPKVELMGILSKGYGITPRVILEDKQVKDFDCRIYHLLQCYAGKGGRARPSLKKLKENTGKNVSTISLSISRLCNLGYVKKIRRGLKQTNIYLLPMEEIIPLTLEKSKIKTLEKSKIKTLEKSKIKTLEKSKIPLINNITYNNITTTTTDDNTTKEISSSCSFGKIFDIHKNKILQELVPIYGINKVILYCDVLSYQYNGKEPEKPFNLLAAILSRKNLILPEGYITLDQKIKIEEERKVKERQKTEETKKQQQEEMTIENKRTLASKAFISLPEDERLKIENRITKEIPYILRNSAIIRKQKTIDYILQEYPALITN